MSDESTPAVLLAFHVISVINALTPERNLSSIPDKHIVANPYERMIIRTIEMMPISINLLGGFGRNKIEFNSNGK
jgi:hypothetical protein